MKDIRVGYVSLKVALEDATAISNTIAAIETTGKKIKPHEMHMTLMYDSANPVSTRSVPMIGRTGEVYEGIISGVSILGDEDSEYRAVVLKIDSPMIELRHRELSIFMKHNFEDFVPHVSVIYGADAADLEKLTPILTDLVGKDILLYGEAFSTVKE